MKYFVFLVFFITTQALWAEDVLLGKQEISSSERENYQDIIFELGYDSLLKTASDKLGFDNPKDVFNKIFYCEGDAQESNGHYKSPVIQYKIYSTHFNPIGLDTNGNLLDVESLLGVQTKQSQIKTESFDGFIRVKTIRSPEICLQKNRSFLEVTATLLHELFHLVEDDFFEQENILTLTKEEYVTQKIRAKNGELNAFVFNIEVAKKIQEVFGINKYSYAYSFFFNEVGETDLEKLEDYLTSSYEDHYSKLYDELRHSYRIQLLVLERYFRGIEEEHKDSLRIAKSNLELAKLKLNETLLINRDFDALFWKRMNYGFEVSFYEKALISIGHELTRIYGELDLISETAMNSSQNIDI